MRYLRSAAAVAALAAAAACHDAPTVAPDPAAPTPPAGQAELRNGWVLDVEGNPRPVQYEVVNGIAIEGGDMGLGPASSIARTEDESRAQTRRPAQPGGPAATMYTSGSRWTGGVMRFKIKAGLDSRIVNAARTAANHYNQFTAETGVRLEEVPSTYTGNYVLVLSTTDAQTPTACAGGAPCSERIGMFGGEQKVWLNLRSNGSSLISIWQVAAHEFGHALGQYHEHSRCERNEYITVHYGIEGPYCNVAGRTTSEPYNVMSIMHYSKTEFGDRADFKVAEPPAKSVHPGLVETDRRSLAIMYGGGGGTTASYVSFMNGRCLDATSSANGTRVYMWDCLGASHPNQRWTYNGATGELKIFGGKCLDAWGAKRLDPIVIHDCHGGGNQKWDISTFGQIRLRGILDEAGRPMCVDIAYYNRNQGAEMVLQYCHRGDNQAWRRSAGGVGGATFSVESDIGRCADAPSSATNTQLHLYDCASGNVNQRFTRTASGELRIHGKCLDGDYSQAGNPVKVFDCHGGANQRWSRDPSGRLVLESNPAVCLDINGGVSANLAKLGLYACHTGGNQKWAYTSPYNP